MTQALVSGAQVLGRKMGCKEAGWASCCWVAGGGFCLGLDEFDGLVGHFAEMLAGIWGDVGGRKGPRQSQGGVEATLCG